ncbi:DUF6151 family protein [Pseudosulfitobacter pseudonitzschiae]|uniref:DUF6151 family protein n=1 Tax=Pseudosulfitobacter pseudonitzschiae TaxID=1402135 RepID=UPI001AFB440B|nr:DUF6151 family protein [Pseudosulfitobacter pseudonitzschiae]MBM1813589.1 hypothetical protein [Pseudosulfitobacter pseudonitzschiae]MBM1830582.1 hypothetical protein [Pseudosulfitobacter pseudonitzschiae]MBM1835449.1 hypothetical protein [Pseudosulfitobacter pseudonitzschiae]MBM1840295.1 hypothetical protein [Pseudosulfitobacter pseudonitzschiae]MBM1845717.1 hypothetical protein [Pseudosulfitobacter pseudonitzschiae]
MYISCDCGAFKAELTHFPAHTPGRLMCYCSDCQLYLKKLGRAELLDAFGGTEIIPVYPSEIRVTKGEEHLVCNRLSPEGLFRWSTGCCNSPVGNIQAKFPWFGILHNAYRAGDDPECLERLGSVRSRIYGRDAIGEPPFDISGKLGLKDALKVMPFLIRGFVGGKQKPSPFFKEGWEPTVQPRLL